MRGIPVIVIIMLCVFSGTFYSQEVGGGVDIPIDEILRRERLREKSYETGLNLRGISGLLLTSRTESIFEEGMFISTNAFFGRSFNTDPSTRNFGFSISWVYGLSNELFGPFKNLEISGNIPIIAENSAGDSVAGFGDTFISGKVQVLEEDPLRESVPSFSLLMSFILPTAKKEFKTVDLLGIEAGLLVGKTFFDSSQMVSSKVYGELLTSFITKDREGDLVVKVNIGIVFPVGEFSDYHILVEFGNVSRSDISRENGNTFAVSVRYQGDMHNITAGFIGREYIDLDFQERSLYFMYDIKF